MIVIVQPLHVLPFHQPRSTSNARTCTRGVISVLRLAAGATSGSSTYTCWQVTRCQPLCIRCAAVDNIAALV
eukprot:3165-Heterococcus_DN1.PRE.1